MPPPLPSSPLSLRFELAACALCFFGSTLLSLRVGATLSAPLPALLINLSSPMLLGLCIATLRKATVELMRADGPLKGTMSHGELTCFKLLLSTLTAAVGALLVEGVFVQTFHDLHARADGPLHGSGGGSMAPVHGLVAVNASLNSLNTSLSSLTALPLLQRHLPLVRNASVAAMAKATVAAVAGLANGSALNDGPSAHGRNGDGDGDGEDGGAGVGGAGGGAGGVGEKLSTDTKPTDTKPVETKPVDSKPPFWTALVRLPLVHTRTQ
ncbi:hypothetical protein T492DRAFT_484760 [Pavlovales sp. CCMP2436]|nr:hypothetical protein T492DRAFT_484760 [Pavlovales sp. CCMP2436]